MSILFCTPCYSGMCTTGYLESVVNLKEDLTQADVLHDFLFTRNESLITRARDTSAATFLKTDYSALMFIDSDIEFTSEDVSKLWNMDVDVAVGAYSMKRPDKPVSAWKDGKLVELKDIHGITPVDYAGTGFMMIKRHVFENMRVLHPEWAYREGNIGDCWGFFQDPIEMDDNERIHLSEDYFFCKRFREMGGKILLDPSINLKHWGMFPY